jgi:hypothetical protein
MSHRRRLGFVAAAIAALAFTAGPAEASAGPCEAAPAAQTFLPWLDVANYVPAPGGDLESTGAWDLRGGAALADGNEPFHVGAAGDSASLSLPAGSSATSAPMCVGVEHPTLRFFARRESSSPLGRLRVDAVAGDAVLPIGVVAGNRSWAPTLPLPIVLNSLALLDGSEQVAFRFTPLLGSEWSVDDVYVDPYRTN